MDTLAIIKSPVGVGPPLAPYDDLLPLKAVAGTPSYVSVSVRVK
jgi:hypothetical protein